MFPPSDRLTHETQRKKMLTDRQIADKVISRQHIDSYGELVRRYSGKVYSKALGVVRSSDLAAEITQQTFVRAYTHLSDWQGTASIGPWLMAIAIRLSINYLDKARRRRTEAMDAGTLQDDYSEEREQMLLALEEAIDALPPQDADIIRLHYYKKQTAGDIARQLGLTTANVLVRLHRIRERLKKQLKPNDNE